MSRGVPHSTQEFARERLNEIKGLDPTRTELAESVSPISTAYSVKSGSPNESNTRTDCRSLEQLCIDEFKLYSTFFDTGETLL